MYLCVCWCVIAIAIVSAIEFKWMCAYSSKNFLMNGRLNIDAIFLPLYNKAPNAGA